MELNGKLTTVDTKDQIPKASKETLGDRQAHSQVYLKLIWAISVLAVSPLCRRLQPVWIVNMGLEESKPPKAFRLGTLHQE